ncbi:class I SAM-dependent methyltransferase [uncultured Desulfobulbus sp.]|uniref:class I SAM-dependent methyltransferase n=1 Tax=uncultured Desulfobulbus sp. TaxID=239745 RepID=UPI0029C61111|nr:class I SAM-dependent methyltransferase [uncultured Desulfobulbus sp.]
MTKRIFFIIFKKLKGSFFHPQWLSDHYHNQSRQLIRQIKSGCVVDIGSGASNLNDYIGDSVELLRVDYPATNCRYQDVPHLYADAARMPFLDASIDTVLLLEVLEHVEQFDLVLAEIKRILKPDGTLYLSAPFIYPAHDVPYDYHRFTRHGLEKDLARHGFGIEIVKQHGNTIVVALQMINLLFLEVVDKTMKRAMLLGLALAMLCYPFCLLNNLISLPFLGLDKKSTSVFGHFVVARNSIPSELN